MAARWRVRRAARGVALGAMLVAAPVPVLQPLAQARAWQALAPPVGWPDGVPFLPAQGASGLPPAPSLPTAQAARIALFNRLPDAEAMALLVPDRARFVAAMFDLRDMVATPGPFDRDRRDRIEADMALRNAAAILRDARRQRGSLQAPERGFACAGDACAAVIPAQLAVPLSPPVVLGATAIILLVMSMGRRVLPWMIALLGVTLATALAIEAVRRCLAVARVMVMSCGGNDGDAPPVAPPRVGGGGAAAGMPPGDPDDPDDPEKRRRFEQSLQHAYGRHGRDWGFEGPWNRQSAAAFEQRLRAFMRDPETRTRPGTYRGNIQVQHHYNPRTGHWVARSGDGRIYTWRLSEEQLRNLIGRGNVQ